MQAEIRGVSFRAYVAYLERVGELDRVRQALPAATRRLVQNPPMPLDWIPQEHTLAIVSAYGDLAGLDAVRAMSRAAMGDGVSELWLPVLRATLGAFGVTPASLLSHSHTLVRYHLRGETVGYVPSGDRGGVVEIRSPGPRPIAALHGWAGVLDYIVALCDATGTITVGDLSADGATTVGRIQVAWDRA